MSDATAPTSTPLQIGVLLVGTVQLLDLSAVDLFAMLTPEYLRMCELPTQLVALGRSVVIHYIAEGGTGSSVETTAGAKVLVTESLDSVGHIDILVVPGPEPQHKNTPAITAFLSQRINSVSALLTICTGVLPILQARLLSGKTATAPRQLIPSLRRTAPDVNWTEKRYVRDEDGKIWTSGGVTNGTDLVAAYVRSLVGPPLSELVLEIADVGERGQNYAGQLKFAPPPPQ